MNQNEVTALSAEIKNAAESAGYIVTELRPAAKGLVVLYRRATGPTVWEELSPDHVSHRGRLDFSTCHRHCQDAEREDKRKLKAAIRLLPGCRHLEIEARYVDHLDKIVPVADGFAFNTELKK